jgi:acyl-homoserine lactone synthase
MVHVMNAGNVAYYKVEKAQAHRLRHQVFVEERHWEALRKSDGYEIDQFDTDDATHILAIEEGAVVGYSRLLPTVGPHLLSDVYPFLARRPIPRAPDVFEWTRYCVSPRKRGETAIGNVGSRVLFGVLLYAYTEGVGRLTMETDPLWATRFFDFGFDVEPLGLPQTLDAEPVVALAITITGAAIDRCRRMLRLRHFAFASRGAPRAALQVPAAA